MHVALGIDVGTTSCKASVVQLTDEKRFHVLESRSQTYDVVTVSNVPGHCEVPIDLVIESVQKCVNSLSTELVSRVNYISVCGQMHGCVLWKRKGWLYDQSRHVYKVKNENISHLITWEDQRCDKLFIDSLPTSPSPLATGYACATVFWLMKNGDASSPLDHRYDHLASIADFLVAMLCDSDHVRISPQQANGFGYFDVDHNDWARETLKLNEFPMSLLPEIYPTGCLAGSLHHDWAGIGKNTPIFVALGDLQSSTYACFQDSCGIAALNIGTSIQLAVCDTSPQSSAKNLNGFASSTHGDNANHTCQRVPYIGSQHLVVAASLNGGNVLRHFVSGIQTIIEHFTAIKIDSNKIWSKLLNHLDDSDGDSELNAQFVATLFGERHCPNSRASLSNISADLSVQKLFKLICQGLIDNIFTMLSIEELKSTFKVSEIRGTGQSLARNPYLFQYLKEQAHQKGLKVSIEPQCDAQVGAVLMVYKSFLNNVAS
ncbi:sedoheptulokinase-like [Brevipalpus obovatus]|uniref:sedoheptulokinase-like n=1 Tax=Brevipalpus obovatus TaxID=246614 RepID=UPI003D9DC1CC